MLLSAKEAVELGLHFNPEGVPANVVVKVFPPLDGCYYYDWLTVVHFADSRGG